MAYNIRKYPAQLRTLIEVFNAAREQYEQNLDIENVMCWVDIWPWIENGHKSNMVHRLRKANLLELDKRIDNVRLTKDAIPIIAKYYDEYSNDTYTTAMMKSNLKRSRIT